LPAGSGLHSCLSPAFLCRSHRRSHMLGSAVLAPLKSAALTAGHRCTDRQVQPSSNSYKYSCAPAILKPILNHQKGISTHVFSMSDLANVLFIDCYLKKNNFAVLKGKINFLSNVLCEGALQCVSRFSLCIFCCCSCPPLLLRGFLELVLGFILHQREFPSIQMQSCKLSLRSVWSNFNSIKTSERKVSVLLFVGPL